MKIQKDKVKHFAVSAALTYLMAYFAIWLIPETVWSAAGGIWCSSYGVAIVAGYWAFILGIGWELLVSDFYKFNLRNIVANAAGVAFSCIIIII